jgi:outer membrane protein assembly factor BamB
LRAASRSLPRRIVRAGLAFAWFVAAAAVFWTGSSVLAQTSTGGAQYQGGAGHPGYVATGPEPAYRTAWTASVPLGGPRAVYGVSAPVVQGDLAIAVGPEQVIAVDATTGTTAWTADRILGPSVPPALAEVANRTVLLFTQGWGSGPPDASVSPSPSVSPASAGTGTPAPSDLVALDLANRKPVWKHDLPDVSRTGVTVDGGAAYVGTNDGTVTAVDLATGKARWSHVVEGTLETTLAAGNGLVLVTSRGHDRTGASVTALHEQDGSQAWRFAPSTSAVAAGPAALGGDTGYVAFTDQTVRAFSLDDGSQRWSSRLNSYVNILSSVAVTPDAIIAVDISGQVYAFDPSTGARRWDFALNTSVFRSPPLAVGGFVLVPTAGGDLDVIELSSGDLIWQSTIVDGPLRDLAVAGDTIVGIAGGTHPGVIGLAHDAAGTLVRVLTPTKLDPASVGLSWVIAAVPFVAIVVFLGRFLVSRLGPAPLPMSGDDDDIEDPWDAGVHPEDEP